MTNNCYRSLYVIDEKVLRKIVSLCVRTTRGVMVLDELESRAGRGTFYWAAGALGGRHESRQPTRSGPS